MHGALRRIDDLGRIVIPKEIRNELRITSGDKIEIKIKEKEIILKKYSELSKIKELSQIITKTVFKKYKIEIKITDMDKYISNNEKISPEIIKKIKENKQQIINGKLITPISLNGEIYGSIITQAKNENLKDTIILLAQILAYHIE